MEEQNKNTILKKLFDNGLVVFVTLSFLSFVLEKIWELMWLQYIHIVFLVGYIIWALISIYSIKVQPLFNLNQIELLFYQILLPILVTLIITIIYIGKINCMDNSFLDSAIKWFGIMENRIMLIIVFWILVLLFSFVAYEREVSYRVAKTECKLPEMIEMLDVSKEIKTISQNVEKMQDTLEKRNEMGYTATCIPIRYNPDHETYVFALIKNLSHEESQWMFPGSHIEVTNNHLKENFDLTDISITPEMVIEEKVKKEAGLLDIQFLDPYYEKVRWDHTKSVKEERSYPNTCYPAKSPVFNYLFRVSKSAKCYKEQNHRCHYDFTYIAEYNAINENEAEYEVVEVEFNKNRNFKTMEYSDAIAHITSKLGNQINKKIKANKKNHRNTLNTPFDQLCLDSIPEMIYNAILFYIDYKEL